MNGWAASRSAADVQTPALQGFLARAADNGIQLTRLTQAARDAMRTPKSDPLKDALISMIPEERAVWDAMRNESDKIRPSLI